MWISFLFLCTISINTVFGAIQSDPLDIDEQGLYRQSDHVIILAQSNFNEKVYGQKHALLIQFYNSFCGHCKAFSSKYKSLAKDIIHWKKAVQLAVCDCSVEENISFCRDFEVLSYPSLRYLHKNYAHGNVGKQMHLTHSAATLKSQLITQLQEDQSANNLQHIPHLGIASYVNFESALANVPNNIIYTFLVFENHNSSIGAELILDTLDYENVMLKRIFQTSELANTAGVTQAPGIVAVKPNLEFTKLSPQNSRREELLNAINTYLVTQGFVFPKHHLFNNVRQDHGSDSNLVHADVVYLSDLEKTIRTSLRTEVVRYKVLDGEILQALIDYLEILIKNFPFKVNGLKYMTQLRDNILTKSSWRGPELFEMINRLEEEHKPVYSSELKYVACQGSEPRYRGYTCGLWTLFHTLTVNAAIRQNSGPAVLKAMHAYVKNFFGCTECSEHFQQMAARNRIFDVMDNNRAVLWLWISHNEVNLRLAGDSTEDPYFPKIQFPSPERCYNCKLVRGAWNLTAVYNYLQSMYGAHNIQEHKAEARSGGSSVYPLSSIDFYMLSLLYILSFIILILVIKLFLTKRSYRKRLYKHDGRGKV